MFKFFLVTSLLGAIANLVQAPWNFFFLIFLIFPILHIILDKIIRNQKYRKRFISIFILLGGFLYFYFLFGFSWIIYAFEYKPELSSFKYITLFGLPFLMLIFASPSFIIPTIFWDTKFIKTISLAACISIGEFLRGNIFTGFSWNNFSHALAAHDNFMQIFSITGQYLATFLLILCAQFVLFFWKKIDYFKALILLSILPIIFFYGSARIKENIFINNRVISVIQPNVLQSDKIDSSDRYEDIKNLIDLSNNHEADLIIWPESSVPLLLQYNPEVIQFIIDNISSKSEILIGNVTFQNEKFRNSALLIDQSKEIKAVYDKTHLVPFGEYMPFKNLLSKLPFLKIVTGDIGFESGEEIKTINTSLGNARIAICYEIIFPEEINPNKEDLDFIVNITNDAWFGNSSGPYQHFISSRFRAIEQGTPVFRSANTGISAIIDPYGRVIDLVELESKGSIVSPLAKKTNETFYSKVGDFLFFSVLVLTLIIMVLLKKKKNYG
tara:strand:+ start:1021 stop:2511 length:1491 start_codon:yes stop_codon:yes gene_type:complete